LRQVIIARNHTHHAPGALLASNGSSAQACTLEAARTQSFPKERL
jgi:hypothetical protein